jgi:hypothetical protein
LVDYPALVALLIGPSILPGSLLEMVIMTIEIPATSNENKFSLEVYDPTGAVEVSYDHAPRLTDLNKATICELSNRMWEYQRIFPLLREMLSQRFPGLKIIPYDEMPNVYTTEPEEMAAVLLEKGCDGAILGNAA